MASFDKADERAKYAVIPKSTTEGKVVKLEPKKIKTSKEVRTVLPEEQYLDNLQKIIVRDYFPELPKLQAQNEYQEALARNDIAKMRELQLRFRTQRRTDRRTSPADSRSFVRSPRGGRSPLQFDPDTPGPSRDNDDELLNANQEGDNEAKPKSALDSMSVDSYLHKYTSEDNASFEELSAIVQERHRNKLKWVYDAEKKHNDQLVQPGNALRANADEQLALRYETEKDKPKALDNWTYSAYNTVLFHPDGKTLTEADKEELARKNQRLINKAATRFPTAPINKPTEESLARAALSHAQANAGKVDVLGNEIGVKSAAFGIVPEPSPMPGVQDSPLMTWGEIDGTPFRLDGADVESPAFHAPAFKIPAVPVREQIAQSMHDNIAKRYREKRKTAMEQAERAHKTPRFGSERLRSLSPAARLLMKNKLGIRLGTNSPLANSPLVKSPLLSSPLVRTPNRTPSSSHSSITDNLLKISFPSPIQKKENEEKNEEKKMRPTAGDFF